MAAQRLPNPLTWVRFLHPLLRQRREVWPAAHNGRDVRFESARWYYTPLSVCLGLGLRIPVARFDS